MELGFTDPFNAMSPTRLRSGAAALAVAALCAFPLSANAEIVYRECFQGASKEPLAGRPPTIRSGQQGGSPDAIWLGPSSASSSAILADGTLDMPAIKHAGASAYLPFRPTAGMLYKLTLTGAEVRSGDWLGTGFILGEAAPDKRFRDNKGVFWALIRSKGNPLTDQTFSGPDIVGPSDATSTSASSITIVLDTTAANSWGVRWFLDGLLVRSGQFAPQPITHFGFGFNTTDAVPPGTSQLKALTLEAEVPTADTDADGLPDAWELAHFRALANEPVAAVLPRSGAKDNPDGDAFSNLEEFIAGSNPNNPASSPLDTDADGLTDGWEIHYFGSIDAPNAHPRLDADGDGFTNLQENAGDSNPTDGKSVPRVANATPAAKPDAPAITMDVARSGRECYLAWTRPSVAIRSVDILRNDKSDVKGRVRIATIESPGSVYLDQTPSAETSYWYWLSYTRPDGKVEEHGPFTSKESKVWTP